MHEETALLPYKLNTFVFCGQVVLGSFLKSLVQAQARAIENITVDMAAYFTSAFEKIVKARLTGLKRLTGFVEVTREGDAYGMDVWSGIDALTRSILLLKSTGGIAGTILPCPIASNTRAAYIRVTQQMMRDFVQKVEGELRAPLA